MPTPQIIPGLSAVADDYDVLLCDVWGVIHNGREAFPAACEALARFRRERGPVVLISNAPRPCADAAAQAQALGVPRESWSAYVTSGDVTRAQIAARAPGPAWTIGADRDETLYAGLDLARAGPQAAAFIVCTGLFDDEVDTPHDYREALSLAAERGLEMVCANPDRVVRRGDHMVWCAGAVADLYTELGGRVVMAGKPHPPIYARSLAEAERLLGRAPDRARVLAIGDGLPTDVAGANAQALDLLFVAAGIDSERLTPKGVLDPQALEAFLGEAQAQARLAIAELAW